MTDEELRRELSERLRTPSGRNYTAVSLGSFHIDCARVGYEAGKREIAAKLVPLWRKLNGSSHPHVMRATSAIEAILSDEGLLPKEGEER